MFYASGPICSTCQSFLSAYLQATIYDAPSEHLLAPNFSSLNSSANSGCYLCQIARQYCLYQWSNALLLSDEHRVILEVSNFHQDFLRQMSKIRPKVYSEVAHVTAYSKPMMLVGLENNSRAHLLLGREYSRLPLPGAFEMGSPEPISHLLSTEHAEQSIYSDQGIAAIVEHAKNWLDICCKDHDTCANFTAIGGHESEKIIPTRLIDVGNDEKGQPARLHITSENDGNGIEYLTLSYAWGPVTDFPKTTKSNLQDMMGMLPWPKLPRTIQDAIIFTRAMGIKYLWVDALCILQAKGPRDKAHKEDWRHEAARFGHYYRNSVLTLAATGASSSDQGLFLPRPGLLVPKEPLVYQEISSDGNVNEVAVRLTAPEWNKEIEYSPLLQRVWATQERYLSTRILHFTPHCVLWECHRLRATEADPSGLHTEKVMRVWGRDHKFISTLRYIQGDDSNIQASWRSFIEGYAGTLFSYPSDRLSALSGIAESMKHRIGENYIAGLWENSIPQDLCWMVTEPFSQSFQKVHTLPSWSWATVGKRVTFLPLIDSEIQVKSWKLKNNGADTSGQVSGAKLRLHGSFIEFNLATDIGLRANPDHDVIDNVLKADSSTDGLRDPTRAYLDTTVARDISLQNHPCLLIGDGTHTPEQSGYPSECALILEATGKRRGQFEEFRRIGFIESITRLNPLAITERTIDLE
ncbi:heterokaryon incompatibility protein-domain-containing protein [Fusarium solani]|uniref:Heterokaryon incompatibility protein-domain-containing protein n=2 Tax=Fusarium solani TaxID=169388 RepID=A0A9P9HY85_FUSSL|nr:heterokaryon incompatibility protein-domain-containing protein [Fusarium solani]KAH7265795.1 heterokaryon incompatibility protein-domain-containing protein [Fusarium solani]